MDRTTIIKQIEAECYRIEEDTKVTAKSQYNNASSLRCWNLILAVAATSSATLAGFSAIKAYHHGTAVIIISSFLSALISAVLATFKPLEKAALHHKFGADFQKLCDDTRIFRTIVLPQEGLSEKELSGKLQELSDRRAELRSKAPQHSGSAFDKTNKGIEQGQASYQVDKAP